jgi:hypothetical protein
VFLSATLIACLPGLAVAHHSGVDFAPGLAPVTVLPVLLAHAALSARLLPAIRLTVAAMPAHGILLASSLVWDAA